MRPRRARRACADEFAEVFKLPKSQVRVITEYMGGGLVRSLAPAMKELSLPIFRGRRRLR